MTHVKLSREELKANIAQSQAEIDKLPDDPQPSSPIPTPSTPIPSPSQPIPSPSTEIPSPSAPIPSPSKPAPSQAIDYQKKASASAREAQVLGFKNKEINKAIEAAAAIDEPTDEEVKAEWPDEWDDMSPVEKRMAKQNLHNKKKFDLIEAATAKFKQVDAWNEKVETFVGDPKNLIKYPELEGKTEEFKQFASKPTRRALEFDDLVLAFNGERAKLKPAPKKGQMFEAGNGGPNEKEKSKDNRLTPEQGEALRKRDYKEWKRLLKAGQIKNE